MHRYIDLVLCHFEHEEINHLYQAPKWSELHEGDEVLVEVVGGVEHAIVTESLTVDAVNKSEKTEFILKAFNEKDFNLKKVVEKIWHQKYLYEEDNNEYHDINRAID